MNLKAIVHEAEEGGFWAEVPAIPGCATEGETMEELLLNLREAITGCLSGYLIDQKSAKLFQQQAFQVSPRKNL